MNSHSKILVGLGAVVSMLAPASDASAAPASPHASDPGYACTQMFCALTDYGPSERRFDWKKVTFFNGFSTSKQVRVDIAFGADTPCVTAAPHSYVEQFYMATTDLVAAYARGVYTC